MRAHTMDWPDELWTAVQEAAKAKGMSSAEWVRRLAVRGLAGQGMQAPAEPVQQPPQVRRPSLERREVTPSFK